METTLSTAFERCTLDLDRFLELWPQLTSHDLLQALEALQGKSVGLFVSAPAGSQTRVEILVDHDAGRAAVDSGGGAKWGPCVREAAGFRITLDNGSGDWVLAGLVAGAVLRWLPRS
jgi:hypothetical protein